MAAVPAIEVPVRLVLANGEEFLTEIIESLNRATAAANQASERLERANERHMPAPFADAAPASEPIGAGVLGETVTESEADTTASEAAPVKRRRTKAQIEEDKAAGLDERFKQLSKEMPNASVDEIRTRMYAERGATASEDNTPGIGQDAAAVPQGDGGGDDDWTPPWAQFE